MITFKPRTTDDQLLRRAFGCSHWLARVDPSNPEAAPALIGQRVREVWATERPTVHLLDIERFVWVDQPPTNES